jgi:hypothetical protein
MKECDVRHRHVLWSSTLVVVLALRAGPAAAADPVTETGQHFTLVGTRAAAYSPTPLYQLTSDKSRRVFVGNNSNDNTGIPVQMFNPIVYQNSVVKPIVLSDFETTTFGDLDGLAHYTDGNHEFLYVASKLHGLCRIDMDSKIPTIPFIGNVGRNGRGSPIVVRKNGNILVGSGDTPGVSEFDKNGVLLSTHLTGYQVNTMTYDPATDLIYFATFVPIANEVRVFNPATGLDDHVATAEGTIDGALALDPKSGLLFVGTANGTNSGLVDIIDVNLPASLEQFKVKRYAHGFNGSVGILREPLGGDLYFLDDTQLYRLPSDSVSVGLPQFGLAKYGKNRTGQSADGIDVVLQGTFTAADIVPDNATPAGWNSGFTIVPDGANTILRWTDGGTTTVAPNGTAHIGFHTYKLPVNILYVEWKHAGAVTGCVTQVSLAADTGPVLNLKSIVANGPCSPGPLNVARVHINWFKIAPRPDTLTAHDDFASLRTDVIPGGPFPISPSDSLPIHFGVPPTGAAYALVSFDVGSTSAFNDSTTDFVLMPWPVAEAPASSQNVLILTDNSSAALNGASHLTDLIAAFRNTGASVSVNSTELTNGTAMPMVEVSGWDAVIVATVTGSPIDASDIPVLQSAVNARASSAFLFFTDACNGCTRSSASAVLPIVNSVGGWSATLGAADNSSFTATLTGSYSGPFSSLASITGVAYSPLVGVPSPNVIYTTNAPGSPGPSAVVAPATDNSACVYMSTDVTQFWVTGGIAPAQANELAAAYLDAALECPSAQELLDVGPGPVSGAFGITRLGPNPAIGQFAVAFRIPADMAARIEVVDIAGRRVRSLELGQLRQGEHRVAFSLHDVRPGTYFVRLVGPDRVSMSKVIILE